MGLANNNKPVSSPMRRLLLPAALAVSIPHSAPAFEMTGATLGLSWGQLTEDSDLNRLDLGGAIELGFGGDIGMQADLGFADFGASDLRLTSFALHGVWHASDASALGLFVGRDDADLSGGDVSQTFVGIEVGYRGDAFEAEAHFAVANGGDGSGAGARLGADAGAGAGSDGRPAGCGWRGPDRVGAARPL
jgi:hypothetical protein